MSNRNFNRNDNGEYNYSWFEVISAFMVIVVVVCVVLFAFNFFKTDGNLKSTPAVEGSKPSSKMDDLPKTDKELAREHGCYTAQESWSYTGTEACVVYTVNYPYMSSTPTVFLNEKKNYTQGFTAVIFSDYISMFDDPVTTYGYETIKARGSISTYEGHPQIKIFSPEQLSVL